MFLIVSVTKTLVNTKHICKQTIDFLDSKDQEEICYKTSDNPDTLKL